MPNANNRQKQLICLWQKIIILCYTGGLKTTHMKI